MSRIEILLLLGFAVVILLKLSNTMHIEGLSNEENTNDEDKENSPSIPAPDEYLDRDSRENTNNESLLNSQALKTMTPSSLKQRKVEADHQYRWVADEWPKCKERCAYRPIHRQIKCYRRNGKRYSDDIPIDKFFTEPAFEKDEFGDTVCDKARSGININVKPSESTFCSLLNSCAPTKQHVIKHPKPIELEQHQQYDRQYIGFSVEDTQNLTDEQKRILEIAFPETRTVQTVSGPKGSTPDNKIFRYATVKDMKLNISSMTNADKGVLSSALQSIRVRTQAEKTFDIGSMVFSTIGVSI